MTEQDQQQPGGQEFKAGTNAYAGLEVAPDPASDPEQSTQETEPQAPKSLEAPDIDTLQRKKGELNGIQSVAHGLEDAIVENGLQVMANRYGGDKVLAALQADDAPVTMSDVVARLAPSKAEQKELQAAIRGESADELAQKLNDTLGGITDAADVADLKSRREYGAHALETNGPSDAQSLLTADLDNLLTAHPELAEAFRQTNDTIGLLKGIRDVYESERQSLNADVEQAKAALEGTKATHEQQIVQAETEATELATMMDETLKQEITSLEAKIAAMANNEKAQAMLRSLLSRRQAEAEASRQELAQQRAAIRQGAPQPPGAESIAHLQAPQLPQLHPISREEQPA